MAKKLSTAATKRVSIARSKQAPLNRGQIALAAIFGGSERYADEFKVHPNGIVERTSRATVEMAAHFLRGKRAFDKFECWEELNRDWLGAFKQQGLVEEVDTGAGNVLYFVTKKAAERFNLKPVTDSGMPFQFV